MTEIYKRRKLLQVEYTLCFLSHMGNLGKRNTVSKGELWGI